MDEPNEEWTEEAYDEAELSDDEFEQECSVDDLLDRVESNDQSLTKLNVSLRTLLPSNGDDRQGRLDRMSVSIGNNTHLKFLMLDGYKLIGEPINEAQAMILFRGIACNRSIKRFHFDDCAELENVCSILAPLFKKNQVERVWIDNCKLSIDSTRILSTQLAEFDSMKDFALTGVRLQIPHKAARELVQALSGHYSLRKLDLSSTNVGKLGCSALADLLSNPNINLRDLNLTSNKLGDAEAAVLSSGIVCNDSLKEIRLGSNGSITEVGWQALFNSLSSSKCSLEALFLNDNKMNDAAAQSLSNALARITSIKSLDLPSINGVLTPTGWRALFGFLRSPTCVLKNLDLSDNQLNDELMTSLIDVLASNRSLKSLNLNDNDGVTGAAWQRLFSIVLANPSSGLEGLLLIHCGINDTVTMSLTDALANNSKLKYLCLSGNNLITNAGCEMFSSILETPNSALEVLHLPLMNDIDDNTATMLVNSLAGNKKLKELKFGHSAEWEPPLGVLYNSDSIISTYNSNHTLEKLGIGGDFPEEFQSLLKINRASTPSEAARLKIKMTHFNEGFIAQPFVGLDLNVLPHAMAWMSRDSRVCKSNSHFYGFIKSTSSLFKNAN